MELIGWTITSSLAIKLGRATVVRFRQNFL
nr:MAG TPA: hypothetical protein [Caudoviricetes sp.]